ncbi:hypothetical protein D3C86_1811170 [compost metagenome]
MVVDLVDFSNNTKGAAGLGNPVDFLHTPPQVVPEIMGLESSNKLKIVIGKRNIRNFSLTQLNLTAVHILFI